MTAKHVFSPRLDYISWKLPEKIKNAFEGHMAGDTVVLQVGTSDVPHENPDFLAGQYTELLFQVQRTCPETKIVVAAIPHRFGRNSAVHNAKTDKLNTHLRDLSKQTKNCRFVDCNPPLLQENYRLDGLHFSRNGCRLFAKFLGSDIRQSNFTQHQGEKGQ